MVEVAGNMEKAFPQHPRTHSGHNIIQNPFVYGYPICAMMSRDPMGKCNLSIENVIEYNILNYEM